MGPVEAFKKLGYQVGSNYDWSVENERGVCLAIWSQEVDWKNTPSLDTRKLSNDENWRANPKTIARTQALLRSKETAGGRVDVVIRRGSPKDNDGTAFAWLPEQRKKQAWFCTDIFPETNDFIIALKPLP